MKRDFNQNGDPYNKYVIFYVDDLLRVCFKPKEDMDLLNIIYWLNERFGPHDQYTGEYFEKVQLKDERVVWSINFIYY